MDLYTLITLLIVATAFFAYLNTRFLRLPDAIGIMVVSLVFSLMLISSNAIYPEGFALVRQTIAGIDFDYALFDLMLSFLLFAGAFHTDAAQLRVQRRSVVLFALVGVVLSTLLVGTGLYYLSLLLGLGLPYLICLLFGALISPTDPIAVLGILAKFKLPESVKINIVGESLFNDGIGVVAFASIYQLVRSGSEAFDPGHIAVLFLEEAGGGVLFGYLLGYGMFLLLRSINHYQTEVIITVAGVMGGYLLAQQLHTSGPLAMVVAGLLTGDEQARHKAMSQTTEEYIDRFWELVDSILNALLFVLIGLELMVIDFGKHSWVLYGLTIGVVLLARYLSILIPYSLARRWLNLDKKAPVMLTWGGLRGGISIAMALSIDSSVPQKEVIVAVTYAVVLFSVIGQGITLERLVRRLYPGSE